MSAIAQRRVAAANLTTGAHLVRQPAVWLALLTFVLYLPVATNVLQLNSDAVEYVDVGRRLASGEGYLLGIKAYFIGGTEVLHNALDERAPLYPLLIAALLRVGFGLNALPVANALLAGACAGLVCLIGSALFGRRTGGLAGLLAALSPPLLIYMLPPMTEALAIFLTLLATWLLIRRLERPRIADFLTAGAALGLGYLTHPTRAVFAAVLVMGIFIASRQRRTLLQPLSALVVGMALFVAPISLYSLATRGSLSYSGQSYMYAVADDREVGLYVPDQPLPEPTQFVLANREVVVGEIVSNARRYAGLIFLDPKWLLWSLPAWPLAAFAALRGWYPRLTWPVLLLAAANFSVAASTWATYQPRYQLMTLLLLLPFGIDGLTRLGLARPGLRLGFRITLLHVVVLAIGLFWFRTFADEYRGTFSYAGDPVQSRSDYGMRWTGPHSWVNDRSLAETTEWINTHTERQDVLAHHAPWVSTFFTGRPSTRLPRRLNAESLKSFLVEYRVSYVLLNSDDYRRRYLDDLRSLEVHGVRSLSVGRHPAFDTRPLWREASG